VARITAWGITNSQVANEPQTANVANSQVSEALAHTGKGDRLIASLARPS
jgi:hypothetical protein